jgi:hypothetical protein
MITISGNCTPSVSIDIEFDENPNGNPVVWIKTGYKQGVHAPLDKKAVEQLIIELQKMLTRM